MAQNISQGLAKPPRGFSLVETLVAITILLLAVVVPMRVASNSIKAATLAREQLTAVFLVQEGIESLMRRRDNAELDGTTATWDWIPAACTGANGCSVEPTTGSVVTCSGSSCLLYLDADRSSGAYYTHTAAAGDASPYTRVSRITERVSDREALITTTVSWYSTAVRDTVSLSLSTTVFNQYEKP